MSFKDREALIREVASEYNKSKIIEIKGVGLLSKDVVGEKQENYIDSKDKYLYYYSLQNRIDYVLEKLDLECSEFIKKEFFSNRHSNNWWINYYSRSTYYRLKKKSMERFLGLLYA